MRNFVLICLIVVTIFISNGLCFGNQKKSHICFRVVDADQDGKVTFQEFKKIFGDDKKKFEAIDLNKDGKLSHDEYHKSLGHGALQLELYTGDAFASDKIKQTQWRAFLRKNGISGMSGKLDFNN